MSAWMRSASSLLKIYDQYQSLLRVCDGNLLVVCAPNLQSDVHTRQFFTAVYQVQLQRSFGRSSKVTCPLKKTACIILYYIYLRAFSCIFFSIANEFVPVTPRWLACKYDGTQNLLYLSVCHSMFFSWGCFFSMSLQRKEGPEGPPGEMGRTGIPVYSFLT